LIAGITDISELKLTDSRDGCTWLTSRHYAISSVQITRVLCCNRLIAGISSVSEAKKVKGMHDGKMRSLRGQLKAAGLSEEQLQQRTVKLPPVVPAAAAAADMDIDRVDAAQQQQQQQVIKAVVQQLGAGTPLAEADAAYVLCFVSLPGEPRPWQALA
jgi:hypothetical protein